MMPREAVWSMKKEIVKDTAESHEWRKSQWGRGNLLAKQTCPGVVGKGCQAQDTEKSSFSFEKQYTIVIRSRMPRFKTWFWHLPAM